MSQFKVDVSGQSIDLEINSFARQSDGSVLLTCGGTVLMITANASPDEKEGIDFLPLTMEYVERTYAAGKIPGGFFKREGRPTEKAILTARLMDRPLRPLVTEGFTSETQVICTVLSIDPEINPDTWAVTGASMALNASTVPLEKPVGCVRIGKLDGKLVVNPKLSDMDSSDLDLVVACTDEAIVMVEGGANNLPEDEMLDALMLAFDAAQPLIKVQLDMQSGLNKKKRGVAPSPIGEDFRKRVEAMLEEGVKAAQKIDDKLDRYAKYREVKDQVKAKLAEDDSISEMDLGLVGQIMDGVKKRCMRGALAETGRRIGGRTTTEVRELDSKVGMLPSTHGSAVFTRGETRALVVATLGTGDDEQRVDALEGEYEKRFMLHYNFPPYCVGEVKFLRSPGRREIGHGALAERAVVRMMPSQDEFPYTVRIVSDILESNGSSSMATVCGSSLALMDAGVPIKAPVAGIAMGLIQESGKFFVLSDILGDEDHIGDMDFKVCGTREGITALQMDIKISGVSREILAQALDQAKAGRIHILDHMQSAIDSPRAEINANAPRIHSMKINPEKIGALIGPGGKVIRGIIAETGVKIDVDDTGKVNIFAVNEEQKQQAVRMIEGIVAEAELGKVYNGIVKRVVDFGAFVEILPGTEGLVHISQLAVERVGAVRDICTEGDEMEVKVIEIDERDGKIRLSRKALLPGGEGAENERRPQRRSGGDGGGGRDRDRSRRR